ncbi:MAG: substrate-binding domain-containing protein [Planctomycetota bacterium]|jgi:putative xylitol transport system substrate-binding protein|nr:substrate-binding domain-containing protein [Planctomycetota bacterium]
MRKSAFWALLAVCVLATTLACQAGQRKYRIGGAAYGLSGEYMKLWATALERHPAVKQGLVEVTVFDGRYDASVQQSQFETMSSQGYDAILFVPIDIQAGAAAVATAHGAGIPVIGSNTRVNSDLLTAYIGSNDVVSGYMEAKAVIQKMGGKGNVVIIEGPIGQSAQIERREGNLKALAEHPDVKVLEMKTANWSRAEALALMENWLTAHPGQIQGVIGQNDEMALGAIQAIKAAGLNLKDFALAGIDGVSDAIQAVKNGEMDLSILQDAISQAQGALDIALGQLIPDYQPMSDCWKDYAEMKWEGGKLKVYDVPWTPITKENADAQWAKRQELTGR